MSTPLTVRLAALGIGIHAINHVVVPLIPPIGFNGGTIYHLLMAPLYAALLLPLLRGRNWARWTITVLLGCQFAGRFVVWVLFPSSDAHAALIAGWVLSIAVLLLLWVPRASRRFFAKQAAAGRIDPARTEVFE